MKHASGKLGNLIFYVGMALAFLLLTGLLTATYEQPVHAGALMQGEPSATITPTFTRTPAPTATSIPTSELPANIITVTAFGKENSLAVNATDIPYLLLGNTVNEVKLMMCNDNEDCDNPLVQTYISSREPALTFDSVGRPVMAYIFNNRMRYTRCSDAICSSSSSKDIETGGNSGHAAIALTSANRAVISYYDQVNWRLKLAICNDNTSCNSPTIRIVDTIQTGQYTSVAVTSADIPIISYFDVGSGDLMLAICNDTTCSAPLLRTIDSAGVVGMYTSLALTDDDIPVISYLDSTIGQLKLARCNNTTCDAPAIHIIEGTSGGQYTSLELLNGELPVISYEYIADRDLRLAVCYTVDCSIVAKFVLDSRGVVGSFASLELDSQNRIYVSYYDLSNGRLKLYLGKYSFNTLPTLTPTFTPTDTPTPTYTHTPTFTDMPTYTPTPTYTYTPTPTPTFTATPTYSPTPTETPATPTSVADAAPAHNFFTTGQPTLTWSRVTWAKGYEVQLAREVNFAQLQDTAALESNELQYTPPILANGIYYWRVRAQKPDGAMGNWSPPEYFVVSS